MKKSEPKMILNISLNSEEIEEKVKIAMDEYAEKVIYKNLDEEITKIVDRRIEKLTSASSWSSDRKIQGVSFEQFVKERAEKTIGDFVEKNIKEILAKRFAEIMTDRSFDNDQRQKGAEMERLTDKNAVGNYFYPKCFEKCDGLGASIKCNNCEIMTSICEKLGEYEDLEEQGRLVKLPCKDVYSIVDIKNPKYATVMKRPIRELTIYEIESIDKENCKYFSTEEKAKTKRKELRGGEDV